MIEAAEDSGNLIALQLYARYQYIGIRLIAAFSAYYEENIRRISLGGYQYEIYDTSILFAGIHGSVIEPCLLW
jgi:hypothetical protein